MMGGQNPSSGMAGSALSSNRVSNVTVDSAMPSVSASPFRSTLESDCVNAVLAERVRQVETFGHTPAHDRERHVGHLPALIVQSSVIMRDAAQPGLHQDLKRAHKHAVRLSAMAMAAADRISHEMDKQNAR